MWVFIRQGSASQNLEALAPDIVRHGPELAAFCTDDREPDTLLSRGHVNDCARLAVAAGVSEIDALLLASTHPARYHGFEHLGSLGPGHQADILCFDELGTWRRRACGRPAGSWPRAGGRSTASCPRRPSPS